MAGREDGGQRGCAQTVIGVLGKRPGTGWCLTCPCALTSDLAVGLHDPALVEPRTEGQAPGAWTARSQGGRGGGALNRRMDTGPKIRGGDHLRPL